MKFIDVLADVTLMAVLLINVESFIFLREFIGPKNPLMSANIAYCMFLRPSEKNMVAKFKGRAKKNLEVTFKIIVQNANGVIIKHKVNLIYATSTFNHLTSLNDTPAMQFFR